MTTKMSELAWHLKQAEIFFIGRGDENDLQSICPALVDGEKNSTGHDLALFFSTVDKAKAYRDHFSDLKGLDIFQATVNEMIEIFNGKVEYFVVDNVPDD